MRGTVETGLKQTGWPKSANKQGQEKKRRVPLKGIEPASQPRESSFGARATRRINTAADEPDFVSSTKERRRESSGKEQKITTKATIRGRTKGGHANLHLRNEKEKPRGGYDNGGKQTTAERKKKGTAWGQGLTSENSRV